MRIAQSAVTTETVNKCEHTNNIEHSFSDIFSGSSQKNIMARTRKPRKTATKRRSTHSKHRRTRKTTTKRRSTHHSKRRTSTEHVHIKVKISNTELKTNSPFYKATKKVEAKVKAGKKVISAIVKYGKKTKWSKKTRSERKKTTKKLISMLDKVTNQIKSCSAIIKGWNGKTIPQRTADAQGEYFRLESHIWSMKIDLQSHLSDLAGNKRRPTFPNLQEKRQSFAFKWRKM